MFPHDCRLTDAYCGPISVRLSGRAVALLFNVGPCCTNVVEHAVGLEASVSNVRPVS